MDEVTRQTGFSYGTVPGFMGISMYHFLMLR